MRNAITPTQVVAERKDGVTNSAPSPLFKDEDDDIFLNTRAKERPTP